MSKILLDSIIMRSSKQVSTNLGNETVILGLQSEEYFGLKDVSAHIWDIIREPKTVKELLEALLKEYEVEPERCECNLLTFLQELSNEGLIEVKDEATP